MEISDRILEPNKGNPEQTMSDAILTAVAEREEIDVCNIQTPLFDSIDPDALEALFRNSPGQVTFEYCGYLVTVDSDRNVALSTKAGHGTLPGTVDRTD
ncbi:MAG: HalOD1 output domain-containing protein [Halolamina sp.]